MGAVVTPRETYTEARGFILNRVCCDDMIPADMATRTMFENARFTRRSFTPNVGRDRCFRNEWRLPASFGRTREGRVSRLRGLAYEGGRFARVPFCVCDGCTKERRYRDKVDRIFELAIGFVAYPCSRKEES